MNLENGSDCVSLPAIQKLKKREHLNLIFWLSQKKRKTNRMTPSGKREKKKVN